ncbi:hypothetical protein ACFXCZ_07830 [Streptomyces sp. NPDC059396]|uniref:hypothetical protein n=1 Tax=Streptomyces sp. NPDC059396 TaxID=3346819 RepID=UPI0036A12F5B
MPTWQQLRDAKLNEYEDAADGWGRVSSRANAAKDRVDNEMLAGIRGTQRGEAATGAVADLERLSRNYQYIHTECGLIRTALNGLATELAAPQRKLGQALEDAENARFTVHPDGSVEYPASADVPVPLAPGRGGTARPGAPAPLLPGLAEGNGDPNRARAEELAERIAAAVREATEIDGRYAGVLRELNTTGGLTVDDSMFADAAQDTRRLQQAARDHAGAQDIPVRHPWSLTAATDAELAQAMTRLKEGLPEQGWKITQYGRNNSPAKSLELTADHTGKKFGVNVEFWEKGTSGNDNPPSLVVTVVSGCFQVPEGEKVKHY